jgi:hypothetical protein
MVLSSLSSVRAGTFSQGFLGSARPALYIGFDKHSDRLDAR